MKYSTSNIGDEIQSIAASRFIPHVDYYIDREHLNTFHKDTHEKVKIILNGWFMDNPNNFPPSDEIEPLIVSMHLCSFRDKMIKNKRVRDYFIQHGPVGCRDKSTMNFLLEHNIPAYFSGCMTTTLIPNMNLKRKREDEYILCVDVSDEIYAHVKEKADKPVFRITKNFFLQSDSMTRFKTAKIMLFVYHQASSVITMNLHTALPCLAFGTPVCLIDREVYDSRFDGLSELMFHCSEHDFINKGFYDINNPPANNDSFIQMRNSITETCKTFTGFDADIPTLEDDYSPDIFSLLDILSVSNTKIYTGCKRLLTEALKKAIHKIFPALFKERSILIKNEF